MEEVQLQWTSEQHAKEKEKEKERTKEKDMARATKEKDTKKEKAMEATAYTTKESPPWQHPSNCVRMKQQIMMRPWMQQGMTEYPNMKEFNTEEATAAAPTASTKTHQVYRNAPTAFA